MKYIFSILMVLLAPSVFAVKGDSPKRMTDLEELPVCVFRAFYGKEKTAKAPIELFGLPIGAVYGEDISPSSSVQHEINTKTVQAIIIPSHLPLSILLESSSLYPLDSRIKISVEKLFFFRVGGKHYVFGTLHSLPIGSVPIEVRRLMSTCHACVVEGEVYSERIFSLNPTVSHQLFEDFNMFERLLSSVKKSWADNLNFQESDLKYIEDFFQSNGKSIGKYHPAVVKLFLSTLLAANKLRDGKLFFEDGCGFKAHDSGVDDIICNYFLETKGVDCDYFESVQDKFFHELFKSETIQMFFMQFAQLNQFLEENGEENRRNFLRSKIGEIEEIIRDLKEEDDKFKKGYQYLKQEEYRRRRSEKAATMLDPSASNRIPVNLGSNALTLTQKYVSGNIVYLRPFVRKAGDIRNRTIIERVTGDLEKRDQENTLYCMGTAHCLRLLDTLQNQGVLVEVYDLETNSFVEVSGNILTMDTL